MKGRVMAKRRKRFNEGEKRKKRQRKEKLAARDLTRRAYRMKTNSPTFKIEQALADPKFAELVEAAIPNIDWMDAMQFTPFDQEFFSLIASRGQQHATQFVYDNLGVFGRSEAERVRLETSPLKHLGDAFLRLLLQMDPDLFPYNDIEVHPRGNGVVLALSSMLCRKTNEGRVYHSRARLKISCNAKDYILAFSPHAIERICERFKPDYKTYGGLADAHSLFSYLDYTELVELGDGQIAIAIFDMCASPGFWEYDNYMGRCMPDAKPRTMSDWQATRIPYGYRVGYCPIAFNEGYAVAKTFLPPGYANTPERRLILEKSSSREERERLLEIAKSLDFKTLREGHGLDAIEWFHKNGVPQVIDPPAPLFNNDYFQRKIGSN